MTKYLLFVLLFLTTALQGEAAAFAPLSKTSHSHVGTTTATATATRLLARPRRRNLNNNNDEPLRKDDNNNEIPQLPAFRGYRASTSSTTSSSSSSSENHQQAPAFVNRKMELQYTCKVCETRNCHKVSRIAYNKGVVIAICKGCMSQHLISDNLGFTQKFDGNIEDYFAANNNDQEGGASVLRVNEDVFHLEKVLGVDTKGGSLLGSDGETYLE